MERALPLEPAGGRGTTVRAAESLDGLAASPGGHRRDPLLEFLDPELDGPRVLTRRGLDLGLLLFGQLDADVALVGHGVLLAWVTTGLPGREFTPLA